MTFRPACQTGVRPPGSGLANGLSSVVLGTALALAILTAPACQGRGKGDGEPPVSLQWSVSPDPPLIGPAKVSIALTDTTTGEPVAGATVNVEGNMTHPGMQPVFGTGRETSPGHYEAPLQFTMGGDWLLLIDATLADGRTLQRQVDVRGVRAR
jgi:hypothetical protein